MDQNGLEAAVLRLRSENASLRGSLSRTANMLNTTQPHAAKDPDDPCDPACKRCHLEKMFPREKVG